MTFKETVKSIERSERYVDEVLRAARLERNPAGINRLEIISSTVITVVAIIAGTIAVIIPLILIAR